MAEPALEATADLLAGLSDPMRVALSLGRKRRLTPADVRGDTIRALEARGLQRLDRRAVRALYAALAARPKQRGKGPLSPLTVAAVHRTLHKALADAVEDGLVPRNAADGACEAPEPDEMATWSPAELRAFLAFLAFVAGDRLFALWRLAATTGLRRGELLGLRWADLDLPGKRLFVMRQAVVARGAGGAGRSIGQRPAEAAQVAAHRQPGPSHRVGAARPPQGPDGGGMRSGARADSGLVFTRADGSRCDPDQISARWARLVARSGLPRIRLHDLRHTCATVALRAGVAVQGRVRAARARQAVDHRRHLPARHPRAAGRRGRAHRRPHRRGRA